MFGWLKGFKSIAIAVLSFLTFALGWEGLTELIDPQIVAMAMAVLMALLRFVTNSSVFRK